MTVPDSNVVVEAPPAAKENAVVFLPAFSVEDPLANYWLRQVTLRLRREVAWLWNERGHSSDDNFGKLPPFREKLATVLDFTRYAEEKEHFFLTNETARYLTQSIRETPPEANSAPIRGTFSWVVQALSLDHAATFVLALALTPTVDHSAGTVFAAVANEASKTFPTLALAQRLWDHPSDIVALVDPANLLWRTGLLRATSADSSSVEWDSHLAVPAFLASPLLSPDTPLPASLRPLFAIPDLAPPPNTDLAIARLRSSADDAPRIQPLIGSSGASLAEAASSIANSAQHQLLTSAPGANTPISTLCTYAWLFGADLFVEFKPSSDASEEKFPAIPPLPVTVFVGIHDRTLLKRLPSRGQMPALYVPALTYPERRGLWQRILADSLTPELKPAIDECARRFRCERSTILAVGRSLRALNRPLVPSDLIAACRAELSIDIGDLAQPVTPRFGVNDLMLPPKQTRQVGEIVTAMQALTTVHYIWGAARAWNECGLSALFAGPPGTGKTMAAEVIAAQLDLPLYRIDLSQVVNKYIGETEKNLRRLFDAADASDVILFFDEADAIFGKRTEVKDAHDRYANLEVSYLLERMERFKGLAILATNRKKDIDEAFLRRLRYTIDFPLPGAEERLRIWRQILPTDVDSSQLDLSFLAQKLPLAGGHLRSIVFNACLQSAQASGTPTLTMQAVLAAAKREYEKLDRPLSRDQLGPHAAFIEGLDYSA